MKTSVLLLAALLLVASVQAQTRPGWRRDSNPIADTENMKSKDGFGAALLLTESEEFFDNWNGPQPAKIPATNTARRNVPLFTAILFAGPATDNAKRAEVTCHVTVRRPDSTTYGELDLVGWNGEFRAPPGGLQLAVGRMGIRIEPDDPSGSYEVEAVVRDAVQEVELTLKTSFNVAQ